MASTSWTRPTSKATSTTTERRRSRTPQSGRQRTWPATWKWCIRTTTTPPSSSGAWATKPAPARTSKPPMTLSRRSTKAVPCSMSVTTTLPTSAPTSIHPSPGCAAPYGATTTLNTPSTSTNTPTPWATPSATSPITGKPSRAPTSSWEAPSGTGWINPYTTTPPTVRVTLPMEATSATRPTTASS